MCQRDSLINQSFLLNVMLLGTSLMMLICGITVNTSVSLQVGYGGSPNAKALGIALLAVMSLASSGCGLHSAKTQNKFCLLIYIIATFSCTVLVNILASSTMADLAPVYESAFEAECAELRTQPTPIEEPCLSYFKSDRQQKLRLFWEGLWKQSREQTDPTNNEYILILEDIQTTGSCCGYGAPLACNSEFDVVNSSSACGPAQGWYESTTSCQVIINTNNPAVIGCPYSMPAGMCLTLKYSAGCSHAIQDWITKQVIPYINGAKYCTICNAFGCTVAIFLFLKRKNDDVLPTAYIDTQAHNYIAKHGLKQ